MTSHFDELAVLKHRAVENENCKEIVLFIAGKAREEIEHKLTGVTYKHARAKSRWETLYRDLAIFSWFEDIHSDYDHTEKWHLKLISPILYRTMLYTKHLLDGQAVIKSSVKEIFKTYPKMREMLKGFGLKEREFDYVLEEEKKW